MIKQTAKAQASGVAGALVAVLAVTLQDYSPLSNELNLALVALAGYIIPSLLTYIVPNKAP